MNQETLLFEPAAAEQGALRAVLAFPSTYTVGITSLGYQVVWATLAQRADVDVRRLFTDQGDPQHRHCDLFGLSLSWELDGPVLLDLLARREPQGWFVRLLDWVTPPRTTSGSSRVTSDDLA